MTDLDHDSGDATPIPEDSVYDLESGIEAQIVEALSSGDMARTSELVNELHYADVADLVERLSADDKARLVDVIPLEMRGDVLLELDETVRDDVIDMIGLDEVAAALGELDTDDAVLVIEDLEEHEQQQVLDAIPVGERTLIEEGLAYPEDSAGRMMQRELVTVPTHWNVGQTIDFLRQSADDDDESLPDTFYNIFIVDPARRPVGALHLDKLLRTRRPVPVIEVMDEDLKMVPAETDQEDVAFLFRRRDLIAAPIVDEGGRLVGVITIDDIVDVIDEEYEEDIMRLGGVREDDLYSAAIDTTRARFSWLFVNLLTAIIASVVIGLFEATIDEIVALAVLMPIVASMGGNAGTQTLTVVVRALAMKELTATNAGRLIGKELFVGAINGVVFALLSGVVAWWWFDNPALGLVIGLAMVVNMIVAGLAGSSIPLVLERAGIDPAVASSVVLTTITDVVGFFVFLGLAALLLL